VSHVSRARRRGGKKVSAREEERDVRRMMHAFRAMGSEVAEQLDRLGALKPEPNPRPWRPGPASLSCVPDVLYPFDPAPWRAVLREFDPNVIPIMVKRVYIAPTGERRIYRFHAIGSRRWNPANRPSRLLERILMPSSVFMPRPTHMDLHFEDRSARRGDGLPGEYVPFDWRIYHGLRALWQDWTTGEKMRWLAENDSAAKARRNRLKIEEDRRQYASSREQQRFLRNHLEKIDRHDVARLTQKVYEPERAITITVPEGVNA
jgi:hypothetical protein